MPDIADAATALRIVHAYVQSKLAANYVSAFASYGGVDCILKDDEPEPLDRVGRPYLVMWTEDDRQSQFGLIYRDGKIAARVVASDASGARTGAANPVGSDTQLSKALCEIIRDGYLDLRALGILRPLIEAQNETITKSDTGEMGGNAGELHVTPHVISFFYKNT